MLNVKLKWIEFENLRTGLKIERVVFNDDRRRSGCPHD